MNDMWNVIDFVTNSLYVATVALRVVAYYRVQKENEGSDIIIDLQREQWDTWDPMLISEGLFSAANIFRFFIDFNILITLIPCETVCLLNIIKVFSQTTAQFVKTGLHFLREPPPWTTASFALEDGNGYHEVLLLVRSRALRLFLR